MKKLLLLSASLVMLLSVAGCTKFSVMFSRAFGADIVFGSSRSSGSNTRVAYSGELDANSYERIDWVEGDKLRIYCGEASEPAACHYADYQIVGTVTKEGGKSSAKIEVLPGASGLKWGEPNTLHKFSSLCPAPGCGVEGTSVGDGTVTCVLPALQTFSEKKTYEAVAGGDSVVFAPNPDYIYLAGYGEATSAAENDESGGEPVNIYYDPVVTTFEFVIKNNYTDTKKSMKVLEAGITTEMDGVLCGTYSVGVTGINADNAVATSAVGQVAGTTSKTISVKFDPVVEVPFGKTMTFTIFAHPGYDITKLKFWFNDEDGCTRTYPFKYADSSKGVDGWVKFIAFHKSLLKGILAPESAGWTINMLPVVTSWNNSDVEVEPDYGQLLTFETPVVVEWETGVEKDVVLKDKKE